MKIGLLLKYNLFITRACAPRNKEKTDNKIDQNRSQTFIFTIECTDYGQDLKFLLK